MTKGSKIRCAIYTRKSTDDGLDQDFNSLDAQHEACTAYVASQRHEGWQLVRDRYDDGGLSGGSLERPALQRLLDNIDKGQVNMVVVYKIDRLTRSLADFAKLVERFDGAGCSFVSVTQAFNTATSMGRLTLNVLLSFAQFEREVTAERIRDKIAASKKKGLWMGGLPPLGYDKHPDPRIRGLVINEGEAEKVQRIFQLYDEHACLRRVAEVTERLGIRSKRRVFANGRARGGSVLSRGQIHFLLTNPIYIGHIRHKDQAWPGQHAAIIDQELWDQVQSRLEAASARQRGQGKDLKAVTGKEPVSPLRGKLRDESGDRLTPTHTLRRGRRHRYYVSNRLIAGKPTDADASGWRLPAAALEKAIATIIADHIEMVAGRHGILKDPDAMSAGAVAGSARAVCTRLRKGDGALLRELIETGETCIGQIRLQLAKAPVASALEVRPKDISVRALEITAPFRLKRRGVETRIVAGTRERQPDPVLTWRLAQAHGWLDAIRAGTPLSDLARRSGHSDAYIRTRMQLAFLSPRLQAAILEGTQPADLTLERILRTGVPLAWSEQEQVFGFGEFADP